MLSDVTPMSLCQVNTHGAVVGGVKSSHRSASQTNIYYRSLKQPSLKTGVCGDSVKKQLTICCSSKREVLKNRFKIVPSVICGEMWILHNRDDVLYSLSREHGIWLWVRHLKH